MSRSYHETDRKWLLVGVYFLSAYWGFHAAISSKKQSSDVLLSVIIAVLVTLYCLAEAKIHNKPINANLVKQKL